MSSASASLEAFEAVLAPFGDGSVPDGVAYQRLTEMTIDHPIAARMAAGLDPFSGAYRDGAMALYRALSGRSGGYEPARDEQSHIGPPPNPWTDVPPWSFLQPALVSEFLLSWGRILRLLDLPAGGRVLEYGCGTGQLLLVLARAGIRAYGVDIDPASLGIARQQAEVLGLPVELETAAFGEGFDGERFERIVFFEAFHHAWDFERLLARLHDRLAPGGRLVFCGEPIVPGPLPPVPFPWGPRLDALSVFCMRRWGWMELGFQHEFFLRALRRTGWRAAFHPVPDCGRAHAYVAEPAPASLLRLGEPYDMGASAGDWGPPDGASRWTKEGTSVLPLPAWSGGGGAGARFVLRVSNPSGTAKRLVVADGRNGVSVAFGPGEGERTVELRSGGAERLLLTCETTGAGRAGGADAAAGLGVAVHDVELLEAPPPPPPAPPALAPGGTGLVPVLKAVGRPLWRRLPEGARGRLRRFVPR